MIRVCPAATALDADPCLVIVSFVCLKLAKKSKSTESLRLKMGGSNSTVSKMDQGQCVSLQKESLNCMTNHFSDSAECREEILAYKNCLKEVKVQKNYNCVFMFLCSKTFNRLNTEPSQEKKLAAQGGRQYS